MSHFDYYWGPTSGARSYLRSHHGYDSGYRYGRGRRYGRVRRRSWCDDDYNYDHPDYYYRCG